MIRLLRDYPYPFLVALLVIYLVNSCSANVLISDGPFHPAAYSSGADGGMGYARLEAADPSSTEP